MMSAEEVRQCADGILSQELERVGQCLCAVETVLPSIGIGPDGGSPRPWMELLVCIPRLFALCLSDDVDLQHDAYRTIRNLCTVRPFARAALEPFLDAVDGLQPFFSGLILQAMAQHRDRLINARLRRSPRFPQFVQMLRELQEQFEHLDAGPADPEEEPWEQPVLNMPSSSAVAASSAFWSCPGPLAAPSATNPPSSLTRAGRHGLYRSMSTAKCIAGSTSAVMLPDAACLSSTYRPASSDRLCRRRASTSQQSGRRLETTGPLPTRRAALRR
jgi:hypothetical protein